MLKINEATENEIKTAIFDALSEQDIEPVEEFEEATVTFDKNEGYFWTKLTIPNNMEFNEDNFVTSFSKMVDQKDRISYGFIYAEADTEGCYLLNIFISQ